jgi:4-hydroxybenzoate polyprenyltransferase
MTFIKNSKAFLCSLRPLNGAIAILSVLLFIQLIQGQNFQFPIEIVGYLMGIFLCMSAGYLINDFYDGQTDNVNRPNRNKLPEKWLLVGSVIFGILACIIAFILGVVFDLWVFSSVLFLSLPLLWLYSCYFQKIAIIGNLLVVILTLMMFLPFCVEGGEVLVNHNELTGFLLLISIITFTREVVKDAEDRIGDELSGYLTLPILMCNFWIKRITEIGILLSIIVLFVTFRWWMHSGIIQLVSIPLYSLLASFLWLSWTTKDTHSTSSFYGRQSKRLKWSMLFFLVYIFSMH